MELACLLLGELTPPRKYGRLENASAILAWLSAVPAEDYYNHESGEVSSSRRKQLEASSITTHSTSNQPGRFVGWKLIRHEHSGAECVHGSRRIIFGVF